jgi:arginine repressor
VKKTRASEFKNVIGERVRLARRAMRPRVSQEDLSGRLAARGIQITQTGISKLENRQRYVMDYEALAIAKVLRVSVGWLYGEAKSMQKLDA